jgi:DNA-binding CsgD family transcriptional regulator
MSHGIASIRRTLEFVSVTLAAARNDQFPNLAVSSSVRDLFGADFAGAGEVDLLGTASTRWADAPDPIPVEADFHDYVIQHPMVHAYRVLGRAVPMRLSDVATTSAEMRTEAMPWIQAMGLSHVLTLPLAVSRRRISSLALMRPVRDFSRDDVDLAAQLQPVVGGIYALRGVTSRTSRPQCHLRSTAVFDPDLDVPLTPREVAVLDLMADGLITAAIARQLGISPQTARKHVENIYRKLGTHDRVSTVLHAQRLGAVD